MEEREREIGQVKKETFGHFISRSSSPEKENPPWLPRFNLEIKQARRERERAKTLLAQEWTVKRRGPTG